MVWWWEATLKSDWSAKRVADRHIRTSPSGSASTWRPSNPPLPSGKDASIHSSNVDRYASNRWKGFRVRQVIGFGLVSGSSLAHAGAPVTLVEPDDEYAVLLCNLISRQYIYRLANEKVATTPLYLWQRRHVYRPDKLCVNLKNVWGRLVTIPIRTTGTSRYGSEFFRFPCFFKMADVQCDWIESMTPRCPCPLHTAGGW